MFAVLVFWIVNLRWNVLVQQLKAIIIIGRRTFFPPVYLQIHQMDGRDKIDSVRNIKRHLTIYPKRTSGQTRLRCFLISSLAPCCIFTHIGSARDPPNSIAQGRRERSQIRSNSKVLLYCELLRTIGGIDQFLKSSVHVGSAAKVIHLQKSYRELDEKLMCLQSSSLERISEVSAFQSSPKPRRKQINPCWIMLHVTCSLSNISIRILTPYNAIQRWKEPVIRILIMDSGPRPTGACVRYRATDEPVL